MSCQLPERSARQSQTASFHRGEPGRDKCDSLVIDGANYHLRIAEAKWP